MHEILNLFKLQPIPKFQQKLINLEKPQNFSKTPKPRFQNMKCMKMRDEKLTKWRKTWKNLEETLRKKFGVSERVFGRWKDESIEREIEKSEKRITLNLYIEGQ